MDDKPWQGAGAAYSSQQQIMDLDLDLDLNAPLDICTSQNNSNEAWEDWLRWEPSAAAGADVDTTSPGDTFNSASSSSKNDSPIQDHVFPVAFAKPEDAHHQSPHIIDDTFNLGDTSGLSDDYALFGGGHINPNFDFSQPPVLLEDFTSAIPKLDTNTANWTLPSSTIAEPVLPLSALSDEHHHSHRLPSTASLAATTPSFQQSPASASNSQKRHSLSSTSPDPPPKKRGRRKRKAEAHSEPSPDNGDNADSQDGDGPPVKKTSHNVIEKRYRNNLNDKIVELRNSVPSLRAMGRATRGDHNEDLEGLTPAHKLNKATVMGKATEYIRHLEKRNKTMQEEMDALKAQLAQVESATGRSRDKSEGFGTSPSVPQRSRETSSASQAGTPTFLHVPQDQTRFGQSVTQQQYMQQQLPPAYARQPNPPVEAQNKKPSVNRRGGVINKAALGTMAAILVMDGSTEQDSSGEDTSARQLFSLPTTLLKRTAYGTTSASPANLSRQAALPLLKLLLVVGVLCYLLSPLLYWSPKRKQRASPTVQLPKAPSLASPVEVRRQAWLTAIQTVWVPKHFLLEVVAVGFKMFQLSMRRLVGAEAFGTITGTNKEEEAARVKAWDIAIDAQLAGGDARVSYYRLLLTLMESGTLPDSPTRLMQKAVHFRLFFWDVANAGYGNILGFKAFTEKVGRIYWESARRQQKDIIHAKAQGRPTRDEEIEALPDHLAQLVELDCDEVLTDEMIQRAWNLAWNKPSAHGLSSNTSKDSVVEDHAIRSPLDAVAAWYSHTLIDDTLADALGDNASAFDTEYYLGLALSVAPPASSTHVRALATKAVLSNTNRQANIVVAFEALPVFRATGGINLVNHAPAPPDVFAALTLAKLMLLCAPSSPRASRTRAFAALNGLRITPGHFTLLTAVAAYRLLRTLISGRSSVEITGQGMEDLAGSLRVWSGTAGGRDSGLGSEGRSKIGRLCVSVGTKLGGWDEDSGYCSGDRSQSSSSARNGGMMGDE